MLNLKIETIFDTKYCQRTFLEKLSGKPSIMKVPFFQHPAKVKGVTGPCIFVRHETFVRAANLTAFFRKN